jgi:hypothetical protein
MGKRITKRLAPCIGGAGLVLFWAIMMFGQETGRGRSEAGGPYPRIPGAVTKPPEGIGPGAPFDVAKFFAAPPYGSNAAPLYLDALSEFSPEVAGCFPEGPERESRRQAGREHSERFQAIAQTYSSDPKSVPTRTIDEIIRLHEVGFRKLAAAQRREQCVFETGVRLTSLLPHVQAARAVARIATLRVQRDVEQEDFEAAIGDVEMVLRLARDLQPRGFNITQLVSAAITQVVCEQMIVPILVARGLRAEHCNRLLKVLVAHEAKSTDGYVEGLRSEYVSHRVALEELVKNPQELAKDLGGLKPGQSAIKTALERLGRPDDAKLLPDDVDARVARTTSAELSRQVETINGAYRTLLGLDGVSYSARIQKIAAMPKVSGSDPLSVLVKGLVEPVPFNFQSLACHRATLRAMECWAALRHWQLSHRGRSPRELASATKGAGLKTVPADPYDGKPLRMATLNGRTIIYSVGKDGKDDGGQRDSLFDTKPGDLIYRPSAKEERQ